MDVFILHYTALQHNYILEISPSLAESSFYALNSITCV